MNPTMHNATWAPFPKAPRASRILPAIAIFQAEVATRRPCSSPKRRWTRRGTLSSSALNGGTMRSIAKFLMLPVGMSLALASPGSAQSLKPLRVTIPVIGMNFLPLFVAADKACSPKRGSRSRSSQPPGTAPMSMRSSPAAYSSRFRRRTGC